MNQATTNRKQLAEGKPFLSNTKSGFFCFYDSICPAFFFFLLLSDVYVECALETAKEGSVKTTHQTIVLFLIIYYMS